MTTNKSSGCFGKLLKIIGYIVLGFLAISLVAYFLDPPDESKKETINDSSPAVESEPIEKEDLWTGYYTGKEKCSMGRNKNEWSNPYEIYISKSGDNLSVRGLYFQANETIQCKINGDQLTIIEQRLGDGDGFIIRGTGIKNGNKLTIDYQVNVLVNFDPKEYETNSCTAEFETQ
jgi:hypothetical protein